MGQTTDKQATDKVMVSFQFADGSVKTFSDEYISFQVKCAQNNPHITLTLYKSSEGACGEITDIIGIVAFNPHGGTQQWNRSDFADGMMFTHHLYTDAFIRGERRVVHHDR